MKVLFYGSDLKITFAIWIVASHSMEWSRRYTNRWILFSIKKMSEKIISFHILFSHQVFSQEPREGTGQYRHRFSS